MNSSRAQGLTRPRKTVALLILLAAPFVRVKSADNLPNAKTIAEGDYVTGDPQSPMREHWILSKTADGRYLAAGNALMNHPETEVLNYRIEMDSALHPSHIELHTIMDLPSYDCRLTYQTTKCSIWFSDEPNAKTAQTQKTQMHAPFDLLGFHSYGWIFSSILTRLPPGSSQVTVHLFLPGETRYPNATANVLRESPESITIAGKSIQALRFRLKLIMDKSDVSEAIIWTSRSGLVLKASPVGNAHGGDAPGVELLNYKQSEPFAPEFPSYE